ncbi:DUF4194 domain-containing protein [Acinetobacter indicus]|uniref:DUF4194 domain-containing protein n=1 Tax=Acinetobacter indicus TaxID=756892 RepID=UPI001443F50A|nr:DUF4194 domain-containing protein [Acinetobacter indicus]
MQSNKNNPQDNKSFFDMIGVSSLEPEKVTTEDQADDLKTQMKNEEEHLLYEEIMDVIQEDSGEEPQVMPHEARRILVHLMRYGTLLAAENLNMFAELCRYETQIRRHLKEVYIQLILDEKQGVAYIINAEQDVQEEEEECTENFPVLIRKRTLTLYDTLILLILRKYYQERESLGEQKIIIDIERIQSGLIPFIPLTNHDSKDRKKLNSSLDKFCEKKVLSVVRGEDGRYEITPIIRYVVNAEFLQNLLTEYQQLAEAAATQPSQQVQGDV